LKGTLENTRVIDCFAGSGTLSFEALSRGAEHAVLIDKDRNSLRVIKENVTSLGCADRITVIGGDALSSLSRLPASMIYDIVFLDPPYRSDTDIGVLLSDFARRALLTEGSLIVFESSPDRTDEIPPQFAQIKRKEYGSTHVTYLRYEGDS
jgi:16S rRNA (guanine966-N2)-methyltransferase